MSEEVVQQDTFDYALLDEETRVFTRVKTLAIRARLKKTAEEIIAIGQDLMDVKARLHHGQFEKWLQSEFQMSKTTSGNFMRVATRFSDKSSKFEDLPISALYELASPSTSDAIVEKVQTGEILPTLDDIKKAKEAERRARLEEAQARADVVAKQQELLNLKETTTSEIDELTKQLDALQKEMEELTTPDVEIREVTKEVVPKSVTLQLRNLQRKLDTLTTERNQQKEVTKAQEERINTLNAEMQAAIRRGVVSENEERIRQNWRTINGEAHSCLMRLLGQWPTPLDVRSFAADDWARVDHLKHTLQRVIEECDNLRYQDDDMIIDSSPLALVVSD